MTDPHQSLEHLLLPDQDEDEPEDVSPLPYERAARPPQRPFLPWHRPRKQFIRTKQWTEAILRIMVDRHPAERIKYVGLPGIDLLDLRHVLNSVCVPQGRDLQFLAFDTVYGGAGVNAVNLALSESELRSNSRVSGQSKIQPDDFRSLATNTSVAWREFERLGPVDVVNLDLTQSVLADPPDDQNSYPDAMRRVISLQLERNPHPWVLLLTTRTDVGSSHPSALQLFFSQFAEAIRECDGARANFEALLSAPLSYPWDHTKLDAKSLQATFIASFTWWLALLVEKAASSWAVTLTSLQVYSVYETGSPDMASLALRFERKGVSELADPFDDIKDGGVALKGLALKHDVTQTLSPCTQLHRIVRRLARARNVDHEVKNDSSLFAELVDESADLLESARYVRADYLAWVSEFTS